VDIWCDVASNHIPLLHHMTSSSSLLSATVAKGNIDASEDEGLGKL
jgi:hypothetical protein